ncbi:uncharacterized protein TNCV_2829771 [Trichonephila clavipes]|nr:uncharacterized protein TNCV_2829771 [Trichonephila clavipes]
MAYYRGTTHQNVINCSSVDWKTLRDFLDLVRSAARAIADDKLFTLTSLAKMWTPQEKMQCVLWLTEFKSVTRVQRHVRTEWNADPLTSKSIRQWERTLKDTGTLISQTGKHP